MKLKFDEETLQIFAISASSRNNKKNANVKNFEKYCGKRNKKSQKFLQNW